MKRSLMLAAGLLASTQVNASVIRVREQALEARTIELVEATATTLVQLAEELSLDLLCLTLANPFVAFLTQGQQINVPLACCGTSCAGPLCSQRSQCQGKSTASKATGTATVIITTSVPATTSTSSTTSSVPAQTTSSSTTTPLTTSSSTTVTSTSSSSSSTTTTPVTTSSSTTSTTTADTTSSSSTTTTADTTSSSSTTTTADTTSSSSTTTTSSTSTSANQPSPTAITAGNLPIALVNNLADSGVNAYITGLDPSGKFIFVKADGTFYYPVATSSSNQPVTENVAIPLGALGSTTTVTTPGYITSGRIWFAQGNFQFQVSQDGTGATNLVQPSVSNSADPNININWGFVEFTYKAGSAGIYANLSFVDFVGMLLGIKLESGDGTTQVAKGLVPNAVSNVCSALQSQTSQDGQPWGSLCQNGADGKLLRVIAPYDLITGSNPQAFSTYYNDYVNQVYSTYASSPLNIIRPNGAGTVACTVTNDQLSCAGDTTPFAKPNAGDIFGCNTGPFVNAGNPVHLDVLPILCAGFHRTTLLLSGGSTQPTLPASDYYTVAPTNYYSKIVHQNEDGGLGYAFPYDDVHAANQPDISGAVNNANPERFTVFVGGGAS